MISRIIRLIEVITLLIEFMNYTKNIYMTEQKSYVILLILQVGCFRGSGLFRLLVL